MRKSLVAAVAALTAVGGATAALAQTGSGASMTVSVRPSKAGTKKKPRGTRINLFFQNNNTSLTATKITILLPKQIKLQPKGFKFCSQATIENTAGAGCPSRSRVGKGSSQARAGVNHGGGIPLAFDVHAFLLSKKKIGFYLVQQGNPSGIKATAVGTFSRASGKFGQKLTVVLPQVAKEYPTGNFNGLVNIKTTLGAKAGKRHLIGLTGCPRSKKLPFSTTISFEPNPSPPATSSVTATATAKCKKK